jgi:hypothetical protein
MKAWAKDLTLFVEPHRSEKTAAYAKKCRVSEDEKSKARLVRI